MIIHPQKFVITVSGGSGFATLSFSGSEIKTISIVPTTSTNTYTARIVNHLDVDVWKTPGVVEGEWLEGATHKEMYANGTLYIESAFINENFTCYVGAIE